MKYQVTIRRTEYREHVFEVEADSQVEAEDKAMEESCDHDFNQDRVYSPGEEVTLVCKMERELWEDD